MKRFFGIFLALFLIQSAYAESATVYSVVDGDTISVHLDGTIEGKATMVRLKNVDTPERTDKCSELDGLAQKAYERVSELLPKGTVVSLKNMEKKGEHSRATANVVLSDGRDVGDILLKEKLGVAYDAKNRKVWCSNADFFAKKHKK